MITPRSRPQASDALIMDVFNRHLDGASNGLLPSMSRVNIGALKEHCKVFLMANRGYYRDSMGEKGVNDFGLYDDAAFLIHPDGILRFNWNCDPSRSGWNASLGKPYANLITGLWPFIRGLHKGQYAAFRQAYEEQAQELGFEKYFTDGRATGEFKVLRSVPERNIKYIDEGYHAINIHRGNNASTSSWGCQTAPDEQFSELQPFTYKLMEKYKQTFLPYLLTDEHFS